MARRSGWTHPCACSVQLKRNRRDTCRGAANGRIGRGAYRQHNGVRFCQGVRALWALSDVNEGDGGLVVVPSSHNSSVDAPQELVDGTDDMELVVQPALNAGDLLLCAESVMRGMRPWQGNGPQRLLECGYISAGVRPSDESEITGEESGISEWAAELTPEQRAIVHNPNRPYPPPVVHSDGERVWFADEPGVFHPSIYTRAHDSGIDEKEFFHWDLCGHLVLRGVMDADWLAEANQAIDANADRISTGGSAAGDSKPLAGTGVGRSSMGDPWKLPAPYGEPFQRMIAYPALIQRLNWIMGSGFECMLCSGFLSGKAHPDTFCTPPVHRPRWATTTASKMVASIVSMSMSLGNCGMSRWRTEALSVSRVVTRRAIQCPMASKRAMMKWDW